MRAMMLMVSIFMLVLGGMDCTPTTESSEWSEWAEFHPNMKEEHEWFNTDFLFPDQLHQLQRVKKQLSSVNRVVVPLQPQGPNLPVPINHFLPRGCEDDFCEDDPEYPDTHLIKEIVRNTTSDIEAAILFNQPIRDEVQVREKVAVPVNFGAPTYSRLRPGVVDTIQTEEKTAQLPPVDEGIVELDPKSNIEYVQETPVCASAHSYVYPRSARNREQEWRFVVNVPGISEEDNFVQAVKVEKCLNNGGACNIFGLGGKTICRQQYSYKKLLAISEAGERYIDSFRFPSCCVCYKQESYGYSGLEFIRSEERTAVLDPPADEDDPNQTNFNQTVQEIEQQIERDEEETEDSSEDFVKKRPRHDRRRPN